MSDQYPYSLRVSKRAKRLQIKINRLAQIEVVSPVQLNQQEVARFLHRHTDWIARIQQKILSARPQDKGLSTCPPRDIHFAYLNKTYYVNYVARDKKLRLCVKQNQITIYANNDEEKTLALREFIHQLAKQELTACLKKYSLDLRLPYNRVFIKAQKTRWGSCSSKKNINLNRNLLFLTPTQVQYIIIHELCHTVHLNHSPQYWALVSSAFPAYKKVEKSLQYATEKIPLWALT